MVLVYSLTNDTIFSLDKPNQTRAAEIPKEVMPSKSEPSAVVRSPDVQQESAHTTEEVSVAAAVERGTLPTNLTETQGQHDTQPDIDSIFQLPRYIFSRMQSCLVSILPDPADVESVVLDETPKQASRPPAGVQQAWEQEAQQPM